MEPHVVLELLLFYAVPQGDVNPLAHALIDHFGDLPGVFDATYEQLLTSDDPDVRELLSLCDILVDGPFVLAERDLTLRFRGSRNQRLIDVPKSLEQGTVVLYA